MLSLSYRRGRWHVPGHPLKKRHACTALMYQKDERELMTLIFVQKYAFQRRDATRERAKLTGQDHHMISSARVIVMLTPLRRLGLPEAYQGSISATFLPLAGTLAICYAHIIVIIFGAAYHFIAAHHTGRRR